MWNKIVEGLRQEPAYLLIFAICALFFLTGIGSAVAAVINDGNIWYLLIAVLCLALALFGTIVVIFRVDNRGRSNRVDQPASPEDQRLLHLSTVMAQSPDGSKLRDIVLAVSENVFKALEFKSPALTEAVLIELAEVRAISRNWANGELRPSGAACNQMLLRMYELAEHTVFATAIAEYHDAVWIKSFGQQLLDTHKAGQAHVTRVFVFDKRNELTEQHLMTMERHVNAGVTVYAYFDDEDDLFQFMPGVPRDFTIIDDGLAIGYTQYVIDLDRIESTWYIGQNDQSDRFNSIRKSLIRGSENFAEVKRKWLEQTRDSG